MKLDVQQSLGLAVQPGGDPKKVLERLQKSATRQAGQRSLGLRVHRGRRALAEPVGGVVARAPLARPEPRAHPRGGARIRRSS